MKNNRTVGIIATVLSALICICAAIFGGIWGVLIASGAPVTFSGTDISPTTSPLPAPLGYALLCLSVLFLLVPVAVGFFPLRKKPEAATPVGKGAEPPAS